MFKKIKLLKIVSICLIFAAVQLSSLKAIAQTKQYEDLLEHRSGFAKDVTGGAGGKVITITAVGNEGYKQFKKAVESDEPKWIRFAKGLKGSVLVDGPLFIGSNTTIDGRGAEITLEGLNHVDEIFIKAKKNVIIHNITFYKMGHVWDEGEALSLVNGTDLVWIDHATFRKNSDESISMGSFRGGKGTARRVTISYCLFEHTPKAILAGWGPGQGKDIRLTVHHSAFVNGVSRIPLFRQGWLHFYNNYILNAGWSGTEVHSKAQALVEYNYYDSSDTIMDCGVNVWDTIPGWICDRGNIMVGGAFKVGDGYNCEKVFNAADYYDYSVTKVDKELYAIVMLYAGWSSDPQWYEE